jgi:sugar lactone lactonase YvrE
MSEIRPAPDLPLGLAWRNVPRAWSFGEELDGQVVLLWFWTESSVHCRQMLPTWRWLEHRYAGRAAVVVGVLCGRFPHEQEPGAAEAVLLRAEVTGPVLLDPDRLLWREFGCRAWPTLVLIDAERGIRQVAAGEPDRERLAWAIDALLTEAQLRGKAARPLVWMRPPVRPPSGLRRPARLHADAARGLLWITDAGNHRLLAADLETGALRHVVGCGQPGAGNGSFEQASFAEPAGFATVGDRLWVADAGNHEVRCVDVERGQVGTVLGKGWPERDLLGGRSGVDQALSTPSSLCAAGGAVYVANSGQHQVWRVDPSTLQARPWAGNGNAALRDGAVALACFAQPVALAVLEGELLVVDADSSALRAIDLARGEVRTRIGAGLFAWGAADGPLADARLQMPLDVAPIPGGCLIADAGNERIRRVDLRRGEVSTWLGPQAGLRRPSGIAVHAGRVFVADSGNDRILAFELATGAPLRFDVEAVPPVCIRAARPLHLRARADVSLRVPLAIPAGARLLADCPVLVAVRQVRGDVLGEELAATAGLEGSVAELRDVPIAVEGEARLRLDSSFLTVHGDGTVCHQQRQAVEFDVTAGPGGELRADLETAAAGAPAPGDRDDAEALGGG